MSDPAPDPKNWITPEEARAAAECGTGRGIRVAVIDSGIEADHPMLENMTLSDSIAFVEEAGRIVVKEGEGEDVYGHGTAVAGIIHELAPEAEIGSFRTIDARSLSRTALICAGIREAIRRGYHILNCSFGCKGLAKFILPHKSWADESWLAGIHVVAACNNAEEDEIQWPSHFASVFAVSFARTETNDIYHRPGRMIGYAARGEDVQVAWMGGGTQIQTGTSFAAPRVSALLARLLSVYPSVSPPLAKDLLPRIVEPWSEDLNCDW